MKPIVLRIDTSARVHCYYTEAIDLAQLGRLEVHRASTVEFNQNNQQWEVRDPAGLLLYSHPSRATCLAWEQEYLQP
jgi:hypothetical protein